MPYASTSTIRLSKTRSVNSDIRIELDNWFARANADFVQNDPISIPHRFSSHQDIEISAFFAAIMSWGNRKTIIAKALDLMERMDFKPHDFVQNARPSDLKRISGFVHRTLNATDVLFLIDFMKSHYLRSASLETAFFPVPNSNIDAVEQGLQFFHNQVFNVEYPSLRTRKHISQPSSGSACKRLNMFLRWMVRPDDNNIDFGLWKNIKPQQLICPLDVHVHRVSLELGLINRKQADWKSAMELTEQLRKLDALDPVKYDLALFNMGVQKRITS